MIYDVLKIFYQIMTDLINESVNDEAVYRTAPATPGLLITTWVTKTKQNIVVVMVKLEWLLIVWFVRVCNSNIVFIKTV